jgi:hypothetical protein
MHHLTLQPMPVLSDGGPHEGQLVLTEDGLVAVFARVTPEETVGGDGQGEGWFLEAGFGPCGELMSVRPPVFATLEEALAWVQERVESGLAGA